MTQRPGQEGSPPVKSYINDKDGVIASGNTLIAGARVFTGQLTGKEHSFTLLISNPIYTQADLQHGLRALGLNAPAKRFFSSAMAALQLPSSHRTQSTVVVIGESGLTSALRYFRERCESDHGRRSHGCRHRGGFGKRRGDSRSTPWYQLGGEVDRFPYAPTHV